MPASFDSIDLKFLYPENWVELPRDDDAADGVTLELPGGGFFSIEKVHDRRPAEVILDELVESVGQAYQDAEHEPVPLDPAIVPPHQFDASAAEIRFYFLDLLIVSRLILITRRDARYVIQAQAESRDFDANLPVFDAVLKQVCDHTPTDQNET